MIENRRSVRFPAVLVAVLLAAWACATPSVARPRGPQADKATLSDARIEEIHRAIDEARLLDASQLIDQATNGGSRDPRLSVLSGEVGLARGRLEQALKDFAAVESQPSTSADALQGEGVALARLGRTAEAIAMLKRALALSPESWRAWNALACEYDHQKDWLSAEAAYERSMAASNGAAIVHNNRGYSRLLQGRYDEAVADFVAALDRKPDLAEARTNLRLALAFRGEYARSVTAGPQDDAAMLLNNAGFAAGVRGDYGRAEELLGEAIKARAQHYERASENLKLVRALEAQAKVQPQ